MAQDIREEMLRFGIIQDIETPYKQRIKELQDYYQDRSRFYTDRMRQADETQAAALEKRWASLSKRIDERLASTEAAYESQLAKQKERIASPLYRQRLSEAQLKETQAKAVAEQEKMRQEKEVMQREEGERQAARFRARGGGRSGARPMLAAARMAPQQFMAPEQTLGAFMPK